MTNKEILLSITKDDFDIQFFRAGGPGGQNQNKVNSGVRLIHRASGARTESRDSRNQLQNKRSAFLKLIETPTFKAWYKIEIAKKLGHFVDIEKKVDAMMQEENLKIEYL